MGWPTVLEGGEALGPRVSMVVVVRRGEYLTGFGEKFQVEERENSKSLGLRQSVPGSLVGVKDTDS